MTEQTPEALPNPYLAPDGEDDDVVEQDDGTEADD